MPSDPPKFESGEDWGPRVLFRSRLDRIDELATSTLKEWGIAFTDLDGVDHGRPTTLERLFPNAALGAHQDHFGRLASQIADFAYYLFIASDTDSAPPGLTPKTPGVADVFHPVIFGPATTVYLKIATQRDANLISCPQVPDVLLGKRDGNFRESLQALRELGAEIIDRINLVAPGLVVLSGRAEVR